MFRNIKKETLNMMQISEQIFKIGIIPVIAIDDADKAVPLACALSLIHI